MPSGSSVFPLQILPSSAWILLLSQPPGPPMLGRGRPRAGPTGRSRGRGGTGFWSAFWTCRKLGPSARVGRGRSARTSCREQGRYGDTRAADAVDASGERTREQRGPPGVAEASGRTVGPAGAGKVIRAHGGAREREGPRETGIGFPTGDCASESPCSSGGRLRVSAQDWRRRLGAARLRPRTQPESPGERWWQGTEEGSAGTSRGWGGGGSKRWRGRGWGSCCGRSHKGQSGNKLFQIKPEITKP